MHQYRIILNFDFIQIFLKLNKDVSLFQFFLLKIKLIFQNFIYSIILFNFIIPIIISFLIPISFPTLIFFQVHFIFLIHIVQL